MNTTYTTSEYLSINIFTYLNIPPLTYEYIML
nr:MAG TPA: hypothetical protein [Caudoviricetes sp.]DAV75017.1 MAG TPA: hypothetical protein [Caudoviricetes sp.]